jgi:hypothetical protein
MIAIQDWDLANWQGIRFSIPSLAFDTKYGVFFIFDSSSFLSSGVFLDAAFPTSRSSFSSDF